LPAGESTPEVIYVSLSAELLHRRWQSKTITFVACQGCTPWFEARVGHLTGTTVLKIVKILKFVLVDELDGTGPDQEFIIRDVLTLILGLKMDRKTEEQLATATLPMLRKAYKTLGFKVSNKTTRQEMTEAVARQHPSNSLVYQRLVTSWCMTPIKKKSKEIVEAFRQGKLAEPLIHNNVANFLVQHSKGMLSIPQLINAGLVKSRGDHISAVSPDAMAVLQCVTELPEGVSADSLISIDCLIIRNYLGSRDPDDDAIEAVFENNSLQFQTLATMEYKHKSEATSITETRNIVSKVLNGSRVRVLSLMEPEDVATFRNAIPNVDYRCQVLHEAVVCNVPFAIYVVATTAIEFVLILLIPPALSLEYTRLTEYIRDNHLYWLFKNEPSNIGVFPFDETLSKMPNYSVNEVSYGYAKDSGTVRCRLQIMMCLWRLRLETGRALLPADSLIPQFVSMWNINKGPIDDMSQVLATCLPSFGVVPGICWIWMRVFSVSLYSGWRLFAIKESREFVLRDQCDNRIKVRNARHYKGGSFREYLKKLYETFFYMSSFFF
jgi:hypothetical protein